ncbi:MAG TPA: tetratricopeptide repeat protein [Phycisphaerae bacterium]|nr:tetratricopeptide repeat protein [Phycisphaerae bacterium]
MALDTRELWQMYTTSGKQFLKLGNLRDAQRMFQAALQVAEGFGHADPRLGVALNNLARVRQARRRFGEAEALYRRALDIAVQTHGRRHADTAVNLANLAGLYQAQGRLDEAETHYKEAIEIFGQTMGDEHPSMARLLDAYATLLRKMGRTDQAAKAHDWAETIRARQAGERPCGQ